MRYTDSSTLTLEFSTVLSILKDLSCKYNFKGIYKVSFLKGGLVTFKLRYFKFYL